MSFKSYIVNLIDFNRSAERAVVRASRLFHTCGKAGKFLGLLYHRHNRKKYGIEIYPQVEIGANLRVPHAVGIVIGKTSVIKDNVTIFPGAMIVARYSSSAPTPPSDERRHAIIENDCMLGAECMIIGPVIIGEGSVIGAGAIVTKDVPPHTTVVNVNEFL